MIPDDDIDGQPRTTWPTRVLGFVFLLLVAATIWFAVGCSTVTPDRVKAPAASYDGADQNSGFIGFFADGSGHITAHARDRYNALVAIYGGDFLVRLRSDAGVSSLSDGSFQIDAEHLVAFMDMAEKQRAGIKPKPR